MSDSAAVVTVDSSVHLVIVTSQTFSGVQREQVLSRLNSSKKKIKEKEANLL